jgi:kynureninase
MSEPAKGPAMTRNDCIELDQRDPLASHRVGFALPDNVVYLDGNSLGALPHAAAAAVTRVVAHEWGEGLIRSWNGARWVDLPRRVGAKIARLIGADARSVICTDSTSINVFKVLACALRLAANRPQVSTRPRNVILTERTNFPTDVYMAQGLSHLLGDRHEIRLVEFDDVEAALDESVAVLMLTHVNYRSGAIHDMAALTKRAHGLGAFVIWDLAHSAGAVPVALDAAEADFAVGCGYKFLNGGPGAPAFVYVAARHLATLADDPFAQPLSGWFGHRAPFEFGMDYRPANGIDRMAVGTPSILALAALEGGVDTVLAAGIDALRAKSIALTNRFIDLVESRCQGLGLELASPRDPARRGSQVSFAHEHAWPVMQALIAHQPRAVIGDCRRGAHGGKDLLRFGFAPLYVRHVDVWDAVEALRDILATRSWNEPEFLAMKAVT